MSLPGSNPPPNAWERYGRAMGAGALVALGIGAGMLVFHSEPRLPALWFSFGFGGLLAAGALVTRLATGGSR